MLLIYRISDIENEENIISEIVIENTKELAEIIERLDNLKQNKKGNVVHTVAFIDDQNEEYILVEVVTVEDEI